MFHKNLRKHPPATGNFTSQVNDCCIGCKWSPDLPYGSANSATKQPVVQGKVFYPLETLPERTCLFTQGALLAGLDVLWFTFWVCASNVPKHKEKKKKSLKIYYTGIHNNRKHCIFPPKFTNLTKQVKHTTVEYSSWRDLTWLPSTIS